MSYKNPNYLICEKCNYKTVYKKDFNKHLTTAKHKSLTFVNIKLPSSSKHHICSYCSRVYRSRVGLWKHIQKCSSCKTDIAELNRNQERSASHSNSGTILELIKQNQDFKSLIVEQQKENQSLQKQLIEVVKDGKTIHNTTTNNNNQKFNLNFFLNTTCKDAMNMSDFIENMNINLDDLENIGKNGYVMGMTDMIVSKIKELDITRRPLHCTDLKRETVYIKDNNEWSKDTAENSKLHEMISCVAKRNCATIPLWREEHPESMKVDHPQYDFSINMMRNVLGDIGSEQIRLDNKVIKKMSKHILVGRNVND
mgnify:CR=1 FL=1